MFSSIDWFIAVLVLIVVVAMKYEVLHCVTMRKLCLYVLEIFL